jgi:sarcosine oxidase subunit alpha
MRLRVEPLHHSVEFQHDGDVLSAEFGEPLAHALIANDRVLLARSPKLHRPRGPYCLRAACDGCLVRVDGVPNVMACRHAVRGGEIVQTQNVVGSREVDLLEATDFLFPEGFDHHRLFAGVRGVSKVVALLARRVAGLGRLPDQALLAREATEVTCDVLIVGGGGAGLAVARSLGAHALLVDDGLQLGGALALLEPERAALLVAAARENGARIRQPCTALGVYPAADGGAPSALLVEEHGITVVKPRFIVLATGAHDRPPPFPGNDLPGIFSARAGLSLLHAGVAPGERIAIVGDDPFARAAAKLGAERLVEHIAEPKAVIAAEGGQRLQQLRIRDADANMRSLSADALLFGSELSPAFELAVQAGGKTKFDVERGYVPLIGEDQQVTAATYVLGRAAGSSAENEHSAERLGQALLRALQT